MLKLLALYFGTIILMALSQKFYPVDVEAEAKSGRHFIRRKADIFMWIAILWMTCFMFLRTSYNDTGNYIAFWKVAPSVKDFIKQGGLTELTSNPLSDFWLTLSHELVDNYHIYFLLPAALVSIAPIKLFKQYSVSLPLSILIFYSIGTYVLYMAALKQCIAMFFLLLAIPYAEKSNIFVFIY